MKTLFDSVDRLEGAMTFHRERQGVLAGNLANLNTPGYRPVDIARAAPMEAEASAVARTQPGHLPAGEVGGAGPVHVFQDAGSEEPDGNAVSLERELAKIDANRVRYSTASELTSRRLALLRYGAGDGNG